MRNHEENPGEHRPLFKHSASGPKLLRTASQFCKLVQMINHDQLPDIATAKLPAAYTVAKRALAECGKIDECKDWADKAAALASYAKQSKDESLFKAAARIQARAIRRCGELLKEIEVHPETRFHSKFWHTECVT